MTGSVVARVLALAAAAFLAGLLALAWIAQNDDGQPGRSLLSRAPWHPAAGSRLWPPRAVQSATPNRRLAAWYSPRNRSGVTHPVLPCGARILIRYGDVTALTEVIDNDLQSSGRQFELTERLALRLKLDGIAADRLALRRATLERVGWTCSTLCVAPGFNVNQHAREGSRCRG